MHPIVLYSNFCAYQNLGILSIVSYFRLLRMVDKKIKKDCHIGV